MAAKCSQRLPRKPNVAVALEVDFPGIQIWKFGIHTSPVGSKSRPFPWSKTAFRSPDSQLASHSPILILGRSGKREAEWRADFSRSTPLRAAVEVNVDLATLQALDRSLLFPTRSCLPGLMEDASISLGENSLHRSETKTDLFEERGIVRHEDKVGVLRPKRSQL